MAKKKKIKLKIKNILICLVIISVILFIFYYILMLPINNIYVKGNEIIKESEILNLAKLDEYPSFLLTSVREVKNNIKKNKYIKDVNINKKLGNKIYIKIEEYSPLCILSDEKLLLSNGEELKNIYSITDVPYLINILDNDIKESFVKNLAKIEKNILRQISQIEYLPINVDNERFLLYMDDGNEVYITLKKIEKLNNYNEISLKMEGTHGIIYLDSGDYIEIKNATEVIDTDKNNESNVE